MKAWLRKVQTGALALLSVVVVGVSLVGCTTTVTTNGVQETVKPGGETDIRNRARIRLELAAGYFSNGQAGVALDEVKQAIAIDPSMYEAYNLRGLIYMRLNDVEAAEDSFRRALSLNPKAANVQHNYGWFLCQQSRMGEAAQQFNAALANPMYGDRSKTWLTLGLCQQKAGQKVDAETSLMRSYELDAGNPVTGYNLALLAFQRRDFTRAQFYARRINNSELLNAESLWLGIKIERQLDNREAMSQLATQLKKRYPQSSELAAFERSAFNE